jgi:uncharacterized protein YjiS (DUF1127 family)
MSSQVTGLPARSGLWSMALRWIRHTAARQIQIRQSRRAAIRLRHFNDQMLADIGLTRGDLAYLDRHPRRGGQ